MAKYILSKKAKGKKYQYTVTDEKGNVISTRTSARDYVACTANGEFYFGRLDLIGKGNHGKGLSRTTEILANPERAYKKQVAYFVPSYRKEWIAENPADEWIARNVNWATERQKELNAIAYLQPGGITPALPVMDIQLTEEQREILSGRICPYCHVPTEYKNSIEVYGVDYGMIYYCPQCGAYVGVHKGTDRAKGRLANAELRRCKIEAHRYFDELYKRGLMKRREAYKWLSDQLGLPPKYTYIGMFNPETCAKVVDVSKKYLLTMRFALRRQDKIKAHFAPNGDEMLNRIKESLTRFFAADRSEFPEGYREIEDCFNQLPGEPYPTIAINDVGNDDRMIEFYVTGKQYDVYHVAFKGFTKG